jgi:hypothetical protein
VLQMVMQHLLLVFTSFEQLAGSYQRSFACGSG